MKARWSKFEELNLPKFEVSDFCGTLDGGQSFRWNKTENFTDSEPEYLGVFGKTATILKLAKNGRTMCSTLSKGDKHKVEQYLDSQRDYAKIRKELAAIGDPSMTRALEVYPTLRILRQPADEAVMCFICSSSKRIIQIKQCVKLLAETFGEEIVDGIFALPKFETLAKAELEDIKKCKLGFRAAYLKKTAEKIVADKFSPEDMRKMDYNSAKKYLTSLSGIGEKVADCILLFGAEKMEAFPVDTWIKKAMSELYNTPDNLYKIREFAVKKFGKYAGFAQQVIFSAKRRNLL